MNTIQLSKLLCIVFLGVNAIGNAQTIYTFDDVSPVEYTIIPNGYGGLEWNNFFIQNTSNSPGFANGAVSSPNVAFNGFGNPASFSSSSAFTLDSGYFTSVYVSQDQLTVEGFAGPFQVYQNTYTISHNSPTLINFDYAGVSSVQFSTSSGTLFTMDNMTLTVPEPSTCALASLAVAFGGFIMRRKKSRSGYKIEVWRNTC